MKSKLYLVFFAILVFAMLDSKISYSNNQVTCASNMNALEMKERITQIKKSIVRVLVNGKPAGSGFVVSNSGLIITCFHIVKSVQPAPNNQTQITYASNIDVEFIDGKRVPASIHQSCQNQGFREALSKDYTILKVEISSNLIPLPLGKFTEANEGAVIYTCGFPFRLDKPFISSGMLSTKIVVPGYLNQGLSRNAALLDITLNKGNSGGPIILIGKNPSDDKVIGIANFTLSPLSKQLSEIVKNAQSFPGNAILMGVDFKKFSNLIKESFEASSVGIGGCISIEYVKNEIPSN